MAIKIQELAFVLRAMDYLSPTLKNVTRHIENMEAAIGRTEHMRKAGEHLALMGAGIAVAGAAIALPLKDAIEQADKLEEIQAALTVSTGGNDRAAHAMILTARTLSLSYAQSADQIAQAEGTLLRATGSAAAAAAMIKPTLDLATGSGMDAVAAGTLLGSVYQNLGNKSRAVVAESARIADKLTYLTTHFSTAEAGGAMLARSFAHVAETSKQYGVSINQALALTGELNRAGLGGGRGAGTYVQQIVEQLGKVDVKSGLPEITKKFGLELFRTANGGVDVLRTLDALKRESPAAVAAFTASLGTSGAALTLLTDKLPQLRTDVAGFINSQGGAAAATAARLKTFDAQWALFGNAMREIQITIGNALLPKLTALTTHLDTIAKSAAAFVHQHKTAVKWIAVLAGINAGLLVLTGGVMALAGGFLLVGSYVPAVVAGIGVLTPVLVSVATGFASAAAASVVFLATNPIGWAIAAVAGLTIVSVAVYKNWAAIKAFIGGWSSWLYSAGANLMHSLASGIASAAMAPIHAVARVASHIRDYFVGHSPPPLGPLHQLNRVHLIETIASTMKPTPMLAAIRRVAQVTAVALPMAIGAPAMSFAGAPGASAGGAPVVLNYAPQITVHSVGGDPAALKKIVVDALGEHAHDLVRILDGELAKRNRAKF